MHSCYNRTFYNRTTFAICTYNNSWLALKCCGLNRYIPEWINNICFRQLFSFTFASTLLIAVCELYSCNRT
uniref:Uncharacterized protein n=1 Tax=Anguilla anguilla TaxID=7936 RepID=A0A0E9XYP8_ANGAN